MAAFANPCLITLRFSLSALSSEMQKEHEGADGVWEPRGVKNMATFM